MEGSGVCRVRIWVDEMPVTAEQMGGVWTSWKEAANEDVVISGEKDKTTLKVGKSGDYGVDSEELKGLAY